MNEAGPILEKGDPEIDRRMRHELFLAERLPDLEKLNAEQYRLNGRGCLHGQPTPTALHTERRGLSFHPLNQTSQEGAFWEELRRRLSDYDPSQEMVVCMHDRDGRATIYNLGLAASIEHSTNHFLDRFSLKFFFADPLTFDLAECGFDAYLGYDFWHFYHPLCPRDVIRKLGGFWRFEEMTDSSEVNWNEVEVKQNPVHPCQLIWCKGKPPDRNYFSYQGCGRCKLIDLLSSIMNDVTPQGHSVPSLQNTDFKVEVVEAEAGNQLLIRAEFDFLRSNLWENKYYQEDPGILIHMESYKFKAFISSGGGDGDKTRSGVCLVYHEQNELPHCGPCWIFVFRARDDGCDVEVSYYPDESGTQRWLGEESFGNTDPSKNNYDYTSFIIGKIPELFFPYAFEKGSNDVKKLEFGNLCSLFTFWSTANVAGVKIPGNGEVQFFQKAAGLRTKLKSSIGEVAEGKFLDCLRNNGEAEWINVNSRLTKEETWIDKCDFKKPAGDDESDCYTVELKHRRAGKIVLSHGQFNRLISNPEKALLCVCRVVRSPVVFDEINDSLESEGYEFEWKYYKARRENAALEQEVNGFQGVSIHRFSVNLDVAISEGGWLEKVETSPEGFGNLPGLESNQ